MNTRDDERAKLDFGDDEESAVPKKPVINPETIREVAAQSGFRKTDVHATRKASGEKQPRHARQPICQSEHDVKRGGCINFRRGLTGPRTRQSTNTQTARKLHSVKPSSEPWFR